MDKNFNASFWKNIEFEGGLSNHALDRGGLTKYGVTQETFNRWRDAMGSFRDSVESLELEEARAIYYNFYWRKSGGPSLPDGLDFAVFQAGVNIGPTMAVKLLQRILGVSDDGVIGPVTMERVNASNKAQLVDSFLKAQADYYKQIVQSRPEQNVFLKGWLNRVEGALAFVEKNWTLVGGSFFS